VPGPISNGGEVLTGSVCGTPISNGRAASDARRGPYRGIQRARGATPRAVLITELPISQAGGLIESWPIESDDARSAGIAVTFAMKRPRRLRVWLWWSAPRRRSRKGAGELRPHRLLSNFGASVGPGWWTATAPLACASCFRHLFGVIGAHDHSPQPPRLKRTETASRWSRLYAIRRWIPA